MLRLLGLLFTAFTVLFFGGLAVFGFVVWQQSKDLPDYEQLARYEPPVMTRIHAGDGSLLAEFAKERRLFVPVNAIPQQLINAFISAEDKNFYTHTGLDWRGLARAMAQNVETVATGGGRLIGASTITQQVAKNFLLTNERTWKRKVREAILSMRIEEAFTKDQIIELYLNEIYLGMGSYGVAAASLNYFGKSLDELEPQEMAYLAALPKAPSNYHPFKHTQRAIERRNYVLQEMMENGFLAASQTESLKAKPLGAISEPVTSKLFAAEFFTEEVRREVAQIYGEEKLYTGGLSIRTTLDPKMQIAARQALTRGLLQFDRKRGFRGALTRIDPLAGDWGPALGKLPMAEDLSPWTHAIVLEVSDKQAAIGLKPDSLPSGRFSEKRITASIPLKLMNWARKVDENGKMAPAVKKVGDTLKVGDVVYVAPSKDEGLYHLVQLPEIQGAIVAMDPHTGRVQALVGGFSYGASQFNRAVQAVRQPGSSFKPFVYAAALDNGYTPASVVLDAPIEVQLQNGETWAPENYSKEFYGPSTLRRGIELSRNVMTVRLAQDMGMDKVASLSERLGIYDNMPELLAFALGAGETTLIRMVAAYSMIDNGGKRIQATLVDRIQDRYGKTIFKHDDRPCDACSATDWEQQPEPVIPDTRADVMNPFTAYQITSMMEGVVQRGTGQALRSVGKPIAGKTGTSNDEKDAWFVGYTPDLAIGVYIGYDTPRPMGRKQTGGDLAAPIVADFLKVALRDEPATPFRVPAGIELMPIDPSTGMRGEFGGDGVILEAFKPGEAPNDEMMLIGGSVPLPAEVLGEGGLTTGTGGLY
jgi:penicillin-binding protein 1A